MIHTRAYKDNAWVAWIVMLWVAWWSLGVSTPRATPAPQLRFHHLHYRAADPLSAMRRLTGSAGIQPSILQGLGVGVRIGGEPGRAEYVLFDRPSERTVASRRFPRYSASATGPTMVTWCPVERKRSISCGSSRSSKSSSTRIATRFEDSGAWSAMSRFYRMS